MMSDSNCQIKLSIMTKRFGLGKAWNIKDSIPPCNRKYNSIIGLTYANLEMC